MSISIPQGVPGKRNVLCVLARDCVQTLWPPVEVPPAYHRRKTHSRRRREDQRDLQVAEMGASCPLPRPAHPRQISAWLSTFLVQCGY